MSRQALGLRRGITLKSLPDVILRQAGRTKDRENKKQEDDDDDDDHDNCKRWPMQH